MFEVERALTVHRLVIARLVNNAAVKGWETWHGRVLTPSTWVWGPGSKCGSVVFRFLFFVLRCLETDDVAYVYRANDRMLGWTG